MARVVRGLLSGRVGDLIYSVRNGKQFVTSAKHRKVPEPSPEQLYRREIFTAATRLAAAVMKDTVLRENWEKSKIKASACHQRFVKKNLPFIRDYPDISLVWLTDSSRAGSDLLNSVFTPQKLT